MLDSLGNNGQGTKVSGTLEELRENHAQNGAFQIFSIETTGSTSDLKQEMLEILPLAERLTQAKEKAANITNNSSPMGVSERITTANKERQQDVVTMVNLPRSSATVGTPISATPPPATVQKMRPSFFTRRTRRNAITTLTGKRPPTTGVVNSETFSIDNPMRTTNVHTPARSSFNSFTRRNPPPSAKVPTPTSATILPNPIQPSSNNTLRNMRGTPDNFAKQTVYGKRSATSDEDPNKFSNTNPGYKGMTEEQFKSMLRGKKGGLRKKKLRTRRATKQKNVRGTRSR